MMNVFNEDQIEQINLAEVVVFFLKTNKYKNAIEMEKYL